MARTGYKITVYLDDNPNSSGYMETYEERVLDESTCPIPQDDLVLVSNDCEIDLSGYTGYRLQIYYNRTTGEYTEVKEEDPECAPSSTEEIWVNSGSPYCETTEQGLNTGYMIQIQVQTNKNIGNYGETRIIRYKSPDCGDNSCPVWDDIQKSCHIGVNDCLATFDGTADITQIDVNPLSPTYNQTRTINKEDSDCENCTETVFSWGVSEYMCGDDDVICRNGFLVDKDGNAIKSTNKYSVKRRYKTIGNGNPIPIDEYEITLYEEDSIDCGYIRPQYRWDVVQGQYVCDYETYTKYQMKVKMVSYDSGATWSAAVPREITSGDVIAYDSYDCGKPLFRWVETNDYECVDNGDDYKLKFIGCSGETVVSVPCGGSPELVKDDLIGVICKSDYRNVSEITMGDCVSSINTVIAYMTGSTTYETSIGGSCSGDSALLKFGDYVESVDLGSGNTSSLFTSGSKILIDENTFDDRLKTIGRYTFTCSDNRYKYKDECLYLGSEIAEIGTRAFWRDTTADKLRTVLINTVIPPSISSDSFLIGGVYGINAVFVPRGSVELYKSWPEAYRKIIFSQAEEDTYFRATYNGGVQGWNFSDEGQYGVLTPEMTHATYKGKTISSMTSAYLSDDVISIAASAFTEYNSYDTSQIALNLTSVSLGKNLEIIGESAFGGQINLYNATGTSGLTTVDTSKCQRLSIIGAGAFNGCVNLTGITIPNTVTRINQSTFKNCSSMTYCNMSTGLTSIGSNAFEGCRSLSAITIPSGVTSLGGEYGADGNAVFSSCSGLTSVTLSSGLTSIGYSTFDKCSGLTSINIPSTVDYIGNYSFRNCISLSSVTIGSGDTYIGGRAFEGCKGITDLNIGNFTTIDGYAFTGCKNINVIDLNCRENGVIKGYAFEGCSGATRINIGSGVTKIEDMAFFNTVYHRADDDNYRPSENTIVVYCYATTPPQIGFGGEYANNRPSPFVYQGIHYVYYYKPVVYVPCSVLDVYTASKWNNICVLKAMDDSCAEIRWVDGGYYCYNGQKYNSEVKVKRYPSGGTWTEWEYTGDRRTVGSPIEACGNDHRQLSYLYKSRDFNAKFNSLEAELKNNSRFQIQFTESGGDLFGTSDGYANVDYNTNNGYWYFTFGSCGYHTKYGGGTHSYEIGNSYIKSVGSGSDIYACNKQDVGTGRVWSLFRDAYNGTCYWIKIYEGKLLVKDYIAVRRISNNVVTLYDRISGTYLAPNGTFKGSDE